MYSYIVLKFIDGTKGIFFLIIILYTIDFSSMNISENIGCVAFE